MGWLIKHKIRDEYLVKYRTNGGYYSLVWSKDIADVKLFKNQKKAVTVISSNNLTGSAFAHPVFKKDNIWSTVNGVFDGSDPKQVKVDELMEKHRKNIEFYNDNYDILGQWVIKKPQDKIVLGKPQNRVCRFCEKTAPEVTFRKEAHAIPHLLGNDTIVSMYECDTCNKEFGAGIEDHLGKWSKPIRTLIRIRGKNGVPTIKKGGKDQGWRLEYSNIENRLKLKFYENDPIFEIDEKNKQITFKLKRDTYIPVAVLKAFMKIGITLMPEEEIVNFRNLIKWVCEKNHTIEYLRDIPVIRSFLPGPMPNDLITALILRRKPQVSQMPYSFLIFGYGNEVFQVLLPAEPQDLKMDGETVQVPIFPIPHVYNPEKYGESTHNKLNLMGTEPIIGDEFGITMGFESIIPVDPSTVKI